MRRYWWLVAVAILAAALAGGVTFGISQLDRANSDTELERAYRAGVDALARGDYQRATDQLGRAAAIDPTFRDVSELLAEAQTQAQAGGDDATGGSSGGASPGGGDGSSTGGGSSGNGNSKSSSSKKPPTVKPGQPGFKRPADLKTLLPDNIPGFNPPQIDATKDLVTAIYLPLRTGEVRQVQVTIHDRKSSTGALGFVNRTLRGVYSRDASTAKLTGSITAYFGTAQGLYATLGWTKGTLAYQVLAEVDRGQPSGLKGRVVDVGKRVG